MNKENKMIVFQDKKIRRIWHGKKWYFAVVDIVKVLSESSDPKQYIKKIRSRDPELNSNWGIICTPLELIADDGKKRKMNCVSVEGVFRIIQSIPSKKAEPFKRWLARVGRERIDEMGGGRVKKYLK